MLIKFAIKDFNQDREYKNLSKSSISGYKFTLNEFHAYYVREEIVDSQEVTGNTINGYILYCQKAISELIRINLLEFFAKNFADDA